MSHNSFGHLFRVTTWGESHGTALGCVVDGCPPGIPLTADDLQAWIDRSTPGGSTSARDTAARVAGGGVARKVLRDWVTIPGSVVQIGPHAIDRSRWDWAEIHNNPFWCPDAKTAEQWAEYLEEVRKAGSSVGA